MHEINFVFSKVYHNNNKVENVSHVVNISLQQQIRENNRILVTLLENVFGVLRIREW